MSTKSTAAATPGFASFPKFDVDQMVALHKANLETFVATQKIMFDLAQTMAKRHSDSVKETFARTETMMKGFDAKKQPTQYMDDAKAVMEKAMAEAKETMDLGMKAQTEVVDLFVKRATANFDEAKSLAA